MYELKNLQPDDPRAATVNRLGHPMMPADGVFHAAILREDGSWVFRFREDGLHPLPMFSGRSWAEEILRRLRSRR